MAKEFILPGISCEKCSEKLMLQVETKRFSISGLRIKCTQCDWEEDLLEKGNEKYEGSKKRVKQLSKEISKSIIKMHETLPKDRGEWGQVVTNPKHPFTAALLTGLVILAMEMSGFGIFALVTWILANVILNPAGWILVPLIVAIAFAFRKYFKGEKLKELKTKLNELEKERDVGELTEEEFEAAKEELLSNYFK